MAIPRTVKSYALRCLNALLVVMLSCACTPAQENGDDETAATSAPKENSDTKPEKESDLIRLGKNSKVWIDRKRKIVVVEGKVVLREGLLEMFACPPQTKEHEAVVAVESSAFLIHTALLAVNAKPGRPVQFAPEYAPANGQEVDVFVLWVDEKGNRHKARAQDWIRHVPTDKPMPHKWVFAGSGFWVDPMTKKRHYLAEDGDLICVSNFSTAMLDLPVESSASNEGLLFDAFTENIPPLGTKVRLVLAPKFDKPADGELENEETGKADEKDVEVEDEPLKEKPEDGGESASGSTD